MPIYHNCLGELHIKRTLPIYSTAFLKSPIIVGFFKPSIYLPIHLISDYDAVGMRYMLLHELQHYKHRDHLVSCLMNFIGILYWFNPLVWLALKEMRSDREIACDTAVLSYLEERDYESYGNTLISLAEKFSLSPFPFASGISGSMKQLQKRILHISSYEKPSVLKRVKGIAAFCIIAAILFGFAPENLNLVKDSICIFSSENQSLYGKTGTGRINGQDKNGWFVGFLETNDDIYVCNSPFLHMKITAPR